MAYVENQEKMIRMLVEISMQSFEVSVHRLSLSDASAPVHEPQ
jgi:hypothetical protein